MAGRKKTQVYCWPLLLIPFSVLNLVYGGDPGVPGQADKKVQVLLYNKTSHHDHYYNIYYI